MLNWIYIYWIYFLLDYIYMLTWIYIYIYILLSEILSVEFSSIITYT